jgi:hypothetical protein
LSYEITFPLGSKQLREGSIASFAFLTAFSWQRTL